MLECWNAGTIAQTQKAEDAKAERAIKEAEKESQRASRDVAKIERASAKKQQQVMLIFMQCLASHPGLATHLAPNYAVIECSV